MKRLTVFLTIVLVLGMLLAACQPTPTPTEEPGDTQPTEETTEAPEGPVTITLWYHSGRAAERDVLQELIDEFNTANEGEIFVDRVELPEGDYPQQVKAAATSNELPCVLDFDGPYVYEYAYNGYLIPLDEYISEEEKGDFLPSIIDQGTYQGNLYSLGSYDSGLALWAHMDMLNAVGARIPTIEEPWTRDEFEDILADLSDLEGVEYPLDMKMNYAQSVPSEWLTYGFSPILQSFGADLIDRESYATAESVLNGPKAVNAMTMIQGWFDNGWANAAPAGDTAFVDGTSAISYVGHWAYGAYKDIDDIQLLPMVDFGNGAKTGMGSWNWGITSTCAHPDLAWEVLNHLTTTDATYRWSQENGALPARISALEQDERYAEGGMLNLFVKQIEAGWAVSRPKVPFYGTITAAFSVAFKNIAEGADTQAELDAAVDKIDTEIETGGYAADDFAPPEVTTITLWYHSGRAAERDVLDVLIDEFNAQNPEFYIDRVQMPEGDYPQSVKAAATSGDLPCVLDFDGPYVYEYAYNDYLVPLDGYISKEDKADFLPSIIDQGTYNGELYSLGTYDSGLAIWAHEDMLAAVGARIPTVNEPWTREEFETILADLKELESVEYPLDMKMNYAQSVPSEWLTYGFSPILQSFGADLIDREDYASAEGVLNGEKAVEAMAMIQGWFDNGWANVAPAGDTSFVDGTSALSYVGHWAYPAYKDIDDILLLPMVDFGTGPKTGMGSWNWGITTQCEVPDAAWEVLAHLTSTDSAYRWTQENGAVPGRQSAFEMDERYAEGGMLNLFVQQIDAGWAVSRPKVPFYGTITAAFSVAFKNIAEGADVQTELDNAVDKIDAEIDAGGY